MSDLQNSQWIDVLKRRMRVIVLFFLLTVSAVASGTYHMTPKYRASSLILVDMEGPNVLATGHIAELAGQGFDANNNYMEYFDSQINLIKSRFILIPVFDEFGIAGMDDYKKLVDPFKKFRKTIEVSQLRGTRFLELSAENKDPKLAANIVNRIADRYVKFNLMYISRNEGLNLLKNEYLILKAKLSEYNKIYKDKHPEIIRLKKEINEIIRDLSRNLMSAFSSKSLPLTSDQDSQLSFLEGLKANNINIVDPAIVPIKPVKPDIMINLLLAIVFGFVGGVVLCFFFEYLEATVRDQEEVESLTAWNFLVKLPRIYGVKKELHVMMKPTDHISEAFKSLRTSIFFMKSERGIPKSIVLTSVGPEEGKTTLITNLAISCARMQKKVLLVDADMRKPRIHDIFHSKINDGLPSYLMGKTGFDEIVQKTKIDNLFVVSDSRSMKHSSELLFSEKAKEFIRKSEENFDLVLYDSPPIGILTDAMVLSSMVDGLILVVQSGKTPRKLLVRIFKSLNEAKVKVFGFIMNRVPMLDSEEYYNTYDYSKIDAVDPT